MRRPWIIGLARSEYLEATGPSRSFLRRDSWLATNRTQSTQNSIFLAKRRHEAPQIRFCALVTGFSLDKTSLRWASRGWWDAEAAFSPHGVATNEQIRRDI